MGTGGAAVATMAILPARSDFIISVDESMPMPPDSALAAALKYSLIVRFLASLRFSSSGRSPWILDGISLFHRFPGAWLSWREPVL